MTYFNDTDINERISQGVHPNYAYDPWFLPQAGYGEEVHWIIHPINFIIKNWKKSRDFTRLEDLLEANNIDFELWKRILKMNAFPNGETINNIRKIAYSLGYIPVKPDTDVVEYSETVAPF